LPDYPVLDAILELYVDRDRGADEIVAAGFDAELVAKTLRMVDRAEYKRRQYPPGTKISPKGFGKDRRLPLTNGWQEQAPPVNCPDPPLPLPGRPAPASRAGAGRPVPLRGRGRGPAGGAREVLSRRGGSGGAAQLPEAGASFIRAAMGRWSLAVLGRVQEVVGSAPLTMIWSMRAIGNDAGQLKPNPLPTAPWVERICEVTAFRARSFMVPFRSPSRTTFSSGSREMASPSASALRSRWWAVKPASIFTRTDGRWAT